MSFFFLPVLKEWTRSEPVLEHLDRGCGPWAWPGDWKRAWTSGRCPWSPSLEEAWLEPTTFRHPGNKNSLIRNCFYTKITLISFCIVKHILKHIISGQTSFMIKMTLKHNHLEIKTFFWSLQEVLYMGLLILGCQIEFLLFSIKRSFSS